MVKSVDWNKQMAMELIKAGFFVLAKKCHPDHGGSHEKMLVLTATKEHLEGVLDGTRYTYQDPPKRPKPEYTREEPPKRPKREKYTEPDRPPGMGKYAYGWYYIDDVRVERMTERAIMIMVPGMDEGLWLPISQLHKTANQVWEIDDFGTIVFSEWIAKQKNWL